MRTTGWQATAGLGHQIDQTKNKHQTEHFIHLNESVGSLMSSISIDQYGSVSPAGKTQPFKQSTQTNTKIN